MSVIPGQLAIGETNMCRSHREEHRGAKKPHQLHGQLTNEVQNGVSLARTYDSLNRPTGYTIMQNGGGNNPVNPVNPVEISYSYDTLGRFSGVGFNAEAQRSRGDFEYSYLPGTDLVSGYTAGGFSRSVTYESDRNLIAAITNSFSPAGETYHLPLSTYHYSNDSLGRRTAITRGGAAFGDLSGATDAYGYNLRSEVVSSRRTLADSPVRGFDYDYAYDPIGNRTSATDYDEQGNPLVSSYSANALNQYTQRTVPGYAALRGEAATNATITINERPVWRINQSIGGSAAPTSARSGGNLGGEAAQTSPQSGSYFFGGDAADNTASAVYKDLEVYAAINPPGTNTPDVVYASTGTVFVAKTPESFTYDADGNMTSDGRFHYFWNGENRLVCASNAEVVVTYAYDHRGRMVTKTLCSSAPLRLIKTTTYIWDNWNIIREIVREGDSVAITDNIWGLDIDGTLQGAGGVGGLLAVLRSDCAVTNSAFCILHSALFFPTYDANGNVSEYVSTNGEVVAHYDYSPFGELLVAAGDLAATFTHQFSTKPYCAVTGFSEYQMRQYNPVIGRWHNRDPNGEYKELHLYAFIRNKPVSDVDLIGLQGVSEADCKNVVKFAWKKSKKIAELVDNMNKHTPPCKVPIVHCRCCTENMSGGYYRTKNRVDICYNHNYTESDLVDTYLHELIHAWNECTGFGGTSCDKSVCDEILANYYSGACDPTGNPSVGDTSKWDCIIRQAAFSSRAFCKEADESDEQADWKARKIGWAILKQCLEKAPKPF